MKNIAEIRVLGVGIFNHLEDVKFVDIDIFDKRKKKVYYYGDPCENLHDNKVALEKVKNKLKVMNKRFNKNIALVERIVKIDTSMLYDGEGGKIDRVSRDRVYISSNDDKKSGYLYITSRNKAIIDIETELYKRA